MFLLTTAGCLLVGVEHSFADSMDPSLSRLRRPPGEGGCPLDPGIVCPDDEAFERLISDLGVALSPAVDRGAASLGLRGFSIGLSFALTPISADRHWAYGTEGPSGAAGNNNPTPDGALLWNRLVVRKGLPFGLEIGGSLGHGLNTSLWLLGAEVRAALFEGYRSGLGALPDVAVRGVFQTVVGSRDVSLHTLTFDVTLSKPYVVAGRHTLTPLIALQALYATAETEPIDLTPAVSAWDRCAPLTMSDEPDLPCSDSARDLENTARFASLDQTRIRLFMGLEEQYSIVTAALTFGLDLTVPSRQADTSQDMLDSDLPRAVTLHFALGLRY